MVCFCCHRERSGEPRRTHTYPYRSGIKSGFANKHGCTAVLLPERFADIRSAIAREKVILGWTRTKQLAWIAEENREFKDLAVQLGWQMLHPQRNIADQT